MPNHGRIEEVLGRAAGTILAPLVYAAARLRRSSLFHPRGVLYRADASPAGNVDALGGLGIRLAGPALVRLSTAWWRGEKEWPDVLGFAVRFTGDPAQPPGPTDQDLLLATIRHPLTTLLAPLSTNPHDFFANDYYAVSPFDAGEPEPLELRVVSPRLRPEGRTRWEKLDRAVADGRAVFTLEARRRRPNAFWQEAALLRLHERVDAPSTLRFDPFRAGRGLRPGGFVSALRPAAYAASKAAGPGRRASTPARSG